MNRSKELSFFANPFHQKSGSISDEESQKLFCARRVSHAVLDNGHLSLACIPKKMESDGKSQHLQQLTPFFQASIDLAINKHWISVERRPTQKLIVYSATPELQLVEICLQGDLEKLKLYLKKSHNLNYWLESIRDNHQGSEICPLIAGIESGKHEVRKYLESQGAIIPDFKDNHLKNNVIHYLATTTFFITACHFLWKEPKLLLAKNNNNQQPLDIANSCQNKSMIHLFQNKIETCGFDSPEVNQTTITNTPPQPSPYINQKEKISLKNKLTDFNNWIEDLNNKFRDLKISETEPADNTGGASVIANKTTTSNASHNDNSKDFIEHVEKLNQPYPIATISELDSISLSTAKKEKKKKKQKIPKKSNTQPASTVTLMKNQLTKQFDKPLERNKHITSSTEDAVIPAKSEHPPIKDNHELKDQHFLKGSTCPIEKTNNSNHKGNHPPVSQEEQKPSTDTTISPAREMTTSKQPDRPHKQSRKQSYKQPRKQPKKQSRKQGTDALPATVTTLKNEPLTVPGLQLDPSPCIKTRIDNIIPRKNHLSEQNEDRELLEHIANYLGISVSVYDGMAGQGNLATIGDTDSCTDRTDTKPKKAHIKHCNIIEAKQKFVISFDQMQKNTLPLPQFQASDRPHLDSREVRETRTYYRNNIDDIIIKKKLPAVFVGSIAYLKQIHALWGERIIERIYAKPRPEIIDKETLETSLTPRDTDLLIASEQQLDEVIDAITDASSNPLLPQHKLDVSPRETRIYYNTECRICKVTFKPHSSRQPDDIAYVVDLIAGPDFGTPESCNFSTISEANRTKRVDEIIMDQFRFITAPSLGGMKRACKAFARIFILAALESVDPRLDTLSRFALLRTLNAFSADSVIKTYADELRKRPFHVACDNGKILGAQLHDS